MENVSWRLEADYIESCNCDFGCPCNFNGFPTGGFCQALVGMHIRSGHYADARLDGLKFVFAGSWPGAIHEGNGSMAVYIDESASPAQREALSAIVYGKAGGSGPFALFASIITDAWEPQFVPITMKVAGCNSGFSIPGILDVRLAPHLDPVSGKEQEIELRLPNGFIWKWAKAVKTAVMKMMTPTLSFDHTGRNAFYSVVEYAGP
ncbi:MAG: DUF1326 domain-containing protein [Candidatus Binataceae bacterium]